MRGLDQPHRRRRAYVAFLGHRLSGLALALFLPVHFWVLGLALEEARLDAFLALAEQPLFKAAEWGLVVLLALHLMFGLRILAMELIPWRGRGDDRSAWIGWGAGAAFACGLVFLFAAA
ncbi:MAG: succinate dehydrogenase [Pseudomonadota bacterium]